MKVLLKNGVLLNVFTAELIQTNVLIENDLIVGVGDYKEEEADQVEDVTGKILTPGFIDGHIHIESSMCNPYEFAKLCLKHGTTSIVADPHEIANVLGVEGIRYMLEASEGLPLSVYFSLPSCVPASPFDEVGAILNNEELKDLYKDERIVALGEMMNFPGVIYNDPNVIEKIEEAHKQRYVVDGHSPSLSGKDLDRYLLKGITSEHEASTLSEALEKMRKGQWIMVREGTAAKNLNALLPLFDDPYHRRAMIVSDDLHPADLLAEGHLDRVIKMAIEKGKSPITAVQMVTLNPAERFHLKGVGALAPGFRADIVVLNDLNTFEIEDVYAGGKKMVSKGEVLPFEKPQVDSKLENLARSSFHLKELKKEDFILEEKGNKCRIIQVVPHEIITKEIIKEVNWDNNGIHLEEDLLKVAVIERHHNTGHIGLGLIQGIGLKAGAIASSVSHDSHNIVVIGTNEEDMAFAANHIRLNGGNVVVKDLEILAELKLAIAGLMSELDGKEVAIANEKVRKATSRLGVHSDIEPFMNMAFVSLPVIPSLKLTTQGLVDVNTQQRVSLYIEE